MATSETITVSIFDKDYQVSCPGNEVQALRDSAFYLDQKMREIKKSGGVLGLESPCCDGRAEHYQRFPIRGSRTSKHHPVACG